jgi:DNA-binding MarR family transcriptional regulator
LAIAEQVEAPAITFGPMEKSIGFLLRIAQLTVSEATFAELNRRDAPIGEFTILLSVDLNPGIRQGVLADRLRIKWSNMTKLVRSLEERGMIVRQVPPDDRRAIALRTTAKGQAQVESHRASVLGAIERSVPTLNEQEKQILLGLLRKVAGWPPL